MTRPTLHGEPSLPTELAAFAERVLGPCTVLLADLSWPYEGSEVYRIRDAHGAWRWLLSVGAPRTAAPNPCAGWAPLW